MPDITSSEPSETSSSSSAPEETPTPVTIASTLRALIAALVASLNCHCNAKGKPEADAAVSDAKFQIGDELTPKEHEHLDTVFAKLQEQPAPVSVIPAAPDPSDTSLPVEVDPRAGYRRINTGAPVQAPVVPAEPTFNDLPVNDETEASSSSAEPVESSSSESSSAPVGNA